MATTANYGYVTPDNGWTIETWFRRTANPTTFAPLFHQVTQSTAQRGTSVDALSGRQLWFGFDSSGRFEFHLNKDDSSQIVVWVDPSGGTYGSDGTWHHVAVRLATDKITWTVLLDGAVLGTGTTTGSFQWNVTSGVLVIAADTSIHRGFYGTYYDAQMAYFAAFNKALSDNRIMEHYIAGNGGTVYYGDTESERVQRLLDWADVPIQSRWVDDAVTTLQGIQVADSNALDQLHQTVDSALGVVFADGQSRIVYQNRRHRYNRFNAVTLGESLQSAPEVEFEFSTDNVRVFNDVRGSRPYGGTIRLQDPLSRAQFGRKVYKFDMSVTSALELRNAVTWFLGRYGEAHPRISGVKFSSVGSPLIEWLTTGGVQIGDSFTITDLDAGWAPDTTMRFVIEQMTLDADFHGQNWKMGFALSPYELYRVFQIGVSSLGDGSYIAY